MAKPAEQPKTKTDEESKEEAKKFVAGMWEAFLLEEEAKKEMAEAKKKAKEDRENGIVAETQLVPIEPVEEPIVPELQEIDSLLAIKNWAMQSPDWKLLNVLFEMLSAE